MNEGMGYMNEKQLHSQVKRLAYNQNKEQIEGEWTKGLCMRHATNSDSEGQIPMSEI
jgi:hypothetical protein